MPYYHSKIEPLVKAGKTILVVAHGNSLRALIMYLDKLSADAVAELNIPTGQALYYYNITSSGDLHKHDYPDS